MKKNYSFFLICTILLGCFLYSASTYAQEKRDFLQHRYDGYTKFITKDFTKKKLLNLKNDLARQGIFLTYKDLVYNDKKEIVKISIHLKNSKSNSNVTLNNKKPIPNTEVGEIGGIVIIAPNAKKEFSIEDFKKDLK